MKIPDLVKDGLKSPYETGYDTAATNLMYKQIKKSPEEIAIMIRETWNYIKQGNASNRIFCHFLYLIQCEVEREWVNDISLDIIRYGLISLEILSNADIKSVWVTKYKKHVLKDFGYPTGEGE